MSRLERYRAGRIRHAIVEAQAAIDDVHRRGRWPDLPEPSFDAMLNDLERQILAVPGLGRYSFGPRNWQEIVEGPAETSGYAINNLIQSARARIPGTDIIEEIEPRDPPHYFAGHPVETVILGVMLSLVSLFGIIYLLSLRHP